MIGRLFVALLAASVLVFACAAGVARASTAPAPTMTLWGVDAFSSPSVSGYTPQDMETAMGRNFDAVADYIKIGSYASFTYAGDPDAALAVDDHAWLYLNINLYTLSGGGAKQAICWKKAYCTGGGGTCTTLGVTDGDYNSDIDGWESAIQSFVTANGFPAGHIVVTIQHEPTVANTDQPKCTYTSGGTDNSGVAYHDMYGFVHDRMITDGLSSSVRWAFVGTHSSFIGSGGSEGSTTTGGCATSTSDAAAYMPDTAKFDVLGTDAYNKPTTDRTPEDLLSCFYVYANNTSGVTTKSRMIGELGEDMTDSTTSGGPGGWVSDALSYIKTNGDMLMVNWNLRCGTVSTCGDPDHPYNPKLDAGALGSWEAGAADPYYGGAGVLQHTTNTANTTSSPAATAFTNPVVAGDTLVVVLSMGGNRTVTSVPSGWTRVSGTSGSSVQIYALDNSGTSPTLPAFTLSGTANWEVSYLELHGGSIASAPTLDGTNTATSGSDASQTSAASGTTSTLAANTQEIAIAATWTAAGPETWTISGGGYTSIDTIAGSGESLLVATTRLPSTGTPGTTAMTAGYTTAAKWRGAVATFKIGDSLT